MNYIDILSRLGTGSAHPGGFRATIEQLEKIPLPENSSILEVGCGTGRTACHLAGLGYRVTGIDIHETMLAKAMKRAETMGVPVRFVKGSATRLPFGDQSFDCVFVESVTNFTRIEQALKEYFRVLKYNGMLFDREMMKRPEMPAEREKELTAFFEMEKLLDALTWKELLHETGFREGRIWNYTRFRDQPFDEQVSLPDELEFIDEGVTLDGEILRGLARQGDLIRENRDYLAYGVLIAKK